MPWDGKSQDGAATIEGEFEWQVTAVVCEGVQPRTVSLRTEPVLFQSLCLAPETATRVAFAGANRLRFFQGGKEVSTVKPSFLFSVHQFEEFVEHPGGEPGHQEGEVLKLGEPSQVEVRFTLNTLPSHLRIPIDLTLEVMPDLEDTSCGHEHFNPRPTGLFRSELIPLPLSEAQTRQLADEVTDHIDLRETTTLHLTRIGETVSTVYIPPIVSGRCDFRVLAPGGLALVSSKTLKVEAAQLEPLEDALSREGVAFVIDDPSLPAPPAGGQVLLTGKTDPHPNNHFGTTDFNRRLAKLAKLYFRDKNERLFYNDMSLICGGKFEIGGDYTVRKQHYEHRLGNNIDMSNGRVRGAGLGGSKRDKALDDWCRKVGLAVYYEKEDLHYHLRLLEKGGGQ
ncbi:MAG: hypothetical protein HY319_20355 [Armatimonadetes bacterium]|nr:hypothetical protein [Armatimonadota bacterium]